MTQESENSLREADLGQTTSGATPDVVDGVAIAKLYGEPLFKVPDGLYIPPDALEVFLESFEGPLDLLLYLIRKQKFDVMNVPMALVTEQYMGYVELIRKSNLELAAEYLVMAACLMQIKSRLLLPVTRVDDDEEVEDPQAELARRLLEYEKMKLAAVELDRIPRNGRDFWRAFVLIEQTQNKILPDVSSEELARVWQEVLAQAQLRGNHTISRQELSVREFMSIFCGVSVKVRLWNFGNFLRRGAASKWPLSIIWPFWNWRKTVLCASHRPCRLHLFMLQEARCLHELPILRRIHSSSRLPSEELPCGLPNSQVEPG